MLTDLICLAGRTPPLYTLFTDTTYLNSGFGDPWAGHARQCDFEDATIKEPKLTDEVVNFGADDPTASLNNKGLS